MREFNTALATYRIGMRAYRGFGLESLDKALADFKVSREDLEELVQKLSNKGVASKLLSRPLYISVVDVEGFTREIIEILRRVEDKILSQ